MYLNEHRMLRLPLSFFDNNQTGYVQSRIGEVDGLGLFFSSASARIILSLLEFIFCLAILFYLNTKLTLISLAFLPVFFLSTKFNARAIRKMFGVTYEKGASLARRILDSLSGIDLIKAFSAEKRESNNIHYYLDELKKINIRRDIYLSLSSVAAGFFAALGGLLILWWSGLDIIKGSFTVGSYIAFAAYVGRLYGPAQVFAGMGITLQPALAALERVIELMELSPLEDDNGIKIRSINKKIEFKNVCFSYDTTQIISNISFTINRGEKLILIGPNGSGKSTIAKLMLGLYKPDEGSISIDDRDISDISLSSLRERISFVSQNVFLFNDTIRNNILYSKPGATDAEVEKAAKLSGAHEFIKQLERGYETHVGERAVKLSAGEKQKLAIARAILRDSDLIIFDEATSHLDKNSETRINAFIQEALKDKICVIISHRNHSVDERDRNYYLGLNKMMA